MPAHPGQPTALEGNLKTFVPVRVQIQGVSQWGCLQYLLKLVKTLQPLAQLSVVYYPLPVHTLLVISELSGFTALIWLTGFALEMQKFPTYPLQG